MTDQEKNIKAKVSQSLKVHTNLDQHAWIILEDKVRLTLIDYQDQYKDIPDWKTPLSIFVTILIAIITANFKEFQIISSATLTGIVYTAAAVFLWFACKNGYNARKKKKMSIEDVIQKLRESSEEQKANVEMDRQG